jgi:hypothetical protein
MSGHRDALGYIGPRPITEHQTMTRLPAIASLFIAASLLPACNGVQVPSPAENGARKVAQATARARALGRRMAPSPDAVGKSVPTEGGEPREVSQPMLAPTDAASQLRLLAGEVNAAGTTDRQRRDGQEVAARMKLDALLLEFAELERASQVKSRILGEVEDRVAAARAIQASGEITAAAEIEARLASYRKAKDAYDRLVAVQRGMVDQARTALQPLEADISSKRAAADQLDGESQALRGQAFASEAGAAMALIEESRGKLSEAQDLRSAAAEADRTAEELRSALRIAGAALSGENGAAKSLDDLVDGASKAAEGARARAAGAKARAEAIAAELAGLVTEMKRVSTEQYDPAVKAVSDALEAGGFPSKSPMDNAAVAVCKARLASIRLDGELQGIALATALGAGEAADGVRANRDKHLAEAKAALLEARDALAGSSDANAAGLMVAIGSMAKSLGIDVSAPMPAAGAADAAAPSGDAAAAEPAADEPAPSGEAPSNDAPPEPSGDEPAPAADPAAPPPGDPAAPPADPTPPPADPGADEPNK